ncbi:MAG: hydrogenase maturation protease [Solirubrobacteraceae bacterium]|jgi:hydrogenase maturation protease|nr:hydrogenase maturation protease [Solirubrobacteraceae bacterium]
MSGVMDWGELDRPGPESVTVAGVELRKGSRVRLRPRAGGDVFDLALAGRSALVDTIECSLDDQVLLAVTVDDDPGADLGALRQPGHRFFFAPEEVEPLPVARVLVAGIGNVFLGDDGWGVALAERLAERPLPPGVEVVDYGIRGMDLAYALGDGWSAVVLLDIAPRGEAPGTLSVIEPSLQDGEVAVDTHGMDPVKVLAMARALGSEPPRTLVVACEPQVLMTGDEEELVADLSAPVRAALDSGVALVEELLAGLTASPPREKSP